MKPLKLITTCLLLLSGVTALAQQPDCAHRNAGRKAPAAKPTIASPEEDYYDVKHLVFDLNLTDTSIYVSGNVTTTAQVVVPAMSIYTFELDAALVIDSLKFNGQMMSVQTTGATLRQVNLSTPLSAGAMFIAQVYYHGTPPTGTGFFTGIIHDQTTSGVDMVYTVSDPYAAKDWWPCKQSIQDKIDSVDMNVTVPTGLKAGSNGLLKNTIQMPGNKTRYEWRERYMIDYYLISVAVANYSDYSYYAHFTGSNDSVLVQNYIYDSTAFMQQYGQNIDTCGLVIDFFSTLFGRYPFWQEKYGHCFTTLGGGMEHQTMTTIGVQNTETIAHELSHQWFGDNVTYATWGDVWLSEGFATYAEQLFLEHYRGAAAMQAYRTGQFTNIMYYNGGRTFVDDTTNALTLFSRRLVYDKGAAIVHMLRFIAPNDSNFFNVLHAYQQQHALGHASTQDLKLIAEQEYSMNLDTFFNQWLYGQGFPRYAVRWNYAQGQAYVQLIQTTSYPTSVALFATPIEIRLNSPQGDTVIKVYNNQPQQTYNIAWANNMTGVTLDPYNNVLNAFTNSIHDQTLSISATEAPAYKVQPNPAKESWTAELPSGATLTLTDISGRQLWNGTGLKGKTIIPAHSLPAGTYLLNIQLQDGRRQTLKLEHL